MGRKMLPSNQLIKITFPDLSPADASIAAKELAQELTAIGINSDEIELDRANADAQDLGSIVVIGGYLIVGWLLEVAPDIAKEFAKGAARRTGERTADAVIDWIAKKYATRAEVLAPSGQRVVEGWPHSAASHVSLKSSQRIIAPMLNAACTGSSTNDVPGTRAPLGTRVPGTSGPMSFVQAG